MSIEKSTNSNNRPKDNVAKNNGNPIGNILARENWHQKDIKNYFFINSKYFQKDFSFCHKKTINKNSKQFIDTFLKRISLAPKIISNFPLLKNGGAQKTCKIQKNNFILFNKNHLLCIFVWVFTLFPWIWKIGKFSLRIWDKKDFVSKLWKKHLTFIWKQLTEKQH